MVQSYYTLDQAAEVLGMPTDELNQLVRKGDIRAFADGGSWKFRTQDIEELQRSRELVDAPDFFMDDDAKLEEAQDVLFLEDESSPAPPPLASDSTVGRELQQQPDMKGSGESDVRLIFSEGGSGSDSDVRLVPDFGDEAAEPGPMDKLPTDSDIRLISDFDEEEPALEPVADELPFEPIAEEPTHQPIEIEPVLEPMAEDTKLPTDSDIRLPLSDSDLTKEDAVARFAPTVEIPTEGDDEPERFASDSGTIPLSPDDDFLPFDDDVPAAPVAQTPPPPAPAAPAASQEPEFSFDDDLGSGFRVEGAGDLDLAAFDLDDKTPTLKLEAGDDDSDSDFSLSLDDDIGLAQDVTPGAGDSGINLTRPDDSGILLKKAADSGIKLRPTDQDTSDSEFDVALDSDDDLFDSDELPGLKASDTAPRMSRVEEDSDQLTDSDFELAIDEESDSEDESGSEVVALEDDDDDESEEYEDEEEEVYGTAAGEPVVVVPQPAPWGGLWVTFLTLTTIVCMVIMIMMYEITRNAWSYNQPYELSATIINSLYDIGQSAGLMP